jgi:hypothetical protein
VSQVTLLAGTGRSAFYQYFSDLYELMETLLDVTSEEIYDAAGTWLEEDAEPVLRLQETLSGLVAICYRLGPILRAIKNTTFESDGNYNLDARVLFHFGYIVVSPAMAVTVPGKGSDYGLIALDVNKQALDGSKTYRLHLPPNVPAKDFWAVTMYDTQTRLQLQTDQQFPTLGSQTDGIKTNDDGSYDIYFSPEAPKGKEGNWLQTIPGKSWRLALRIYGSMQPWIDQSRRSGEIELQRRER